MQHRWKYCILARLAQNSEKKFTKLQLAKIYAAENHKIAFTSKASYKRIVTLLNFHQELKLLTKLKFYTKVFFFSNFDIFSKITMFVHFMVYWVIFTLVILVNRTCVGNFQLWNRKIVRVQQKLTQSEKIEKRLVLERARSVSVRGL